MQNLKKLGLFSLLVLLVNSVAASQYQIKNDPAAMLYYQQSLIALPRTQDQSRFGLGLGILQQSFEPGFNTPLSPFHVSNVLDFGIGKYGLEKIRLNDVVVWAGSEIDISREENPRIQPSKWAWVGIVAAVAFGASCAAGGAPCNSFLEGQADLSRVGEEGFKFASRPVVPVQFDRVRAGK